MVQSVLTVLVSALIGVLLLWNNMSKTLQDRDEACDVGMHILLNDVERNYEILTVDVMTESLRAFSREVWVKLNTPLAVITLLESLTKYRTQKKDFIFSHLRPLSYSLFQTYLKSGISEVSIYVMDGGLYGHSQFFSTFNNGNASKSPNLLTVEYYGPTESIFIQNQYNVTAGSTDPYTGGVLRIPGANGCENIAIGIYPTGECVLPRNVIGQEYTGANWVSDVIQEAEFGAIGWLPIQTKSRLLTKTAFLSTSSDGLTVFNTTNTSNIILIQVGIDLVSLSNAAQRATEGLPSGSRLYGVEITKGGSAVVAVSHGNPFHVIDNNVNQLIHPWNASDGVVSAHGQFMFQNNLSYATMSPHSNWNWNQQNYWVQTDRLIHSNDSIHKLSFTIIMIVPVDTALQKVHQATQTALGQVNQERNRVDRESTNRNIPMWTSLALCLVALSCLSFVSSIWFTKPILILSKEMQTVADMKLDFITSAGHSRLTEVRAMQDSFALMLDALKEYRTYLPASVLCNEQDDGSEYPDPEADMMTTEMTGPNQSHVSAEITLECSNASSFHSLVSKRTSCQLSSMKDLKDIPETERRPSAVPDRVGTLQSNLVLKRSVVALTFQLRDFHDWVAQQNETSSGLQSVVRGVSEWIEAVDCIITSHRGLVLWTMLGDSEVTAVWGFHARVHTGVTKAVDTALEISQVTSSSDGVQHIGLPPLSAHCAVSDSYCFAGNLGSGKIRAPAVVGHQKSSNSRLIRVGMHFNLNCLVTDSRSLEAYEITPVDCCKLQSVLSLGGAELFPECGLVTVFAVLSKPKQDTEWMYGLTALEEKLRPLLIAYSDYAKGNYTSARRAAENLLKSGIMECEANRLLFLIPPQGDESRSSRCGKTSTPLVVADANAGASGFGRLLSNAHQSMKRNITTSYRDRSYSE